VPGINSRIQSCTGHGTLDDAGNRGAAQSRPPQNITGLNAAKKGAIPGATKRKPGTQNPHRISSGAPPGPDANHAAPAALIGLRIVHNNSEPLRLETHIGKLKPRQLTAPQRSGEAKDNERPITRPTGRRRIAAPGDSQEIRRRQSGLPSGLLTPITPDSRYDLPSLSTRRDLLGRSPMMVTDRSQMPRAGLGAPTVLRQQPRDVQRHGLRRCRKRITPRRLAPGTKRPPVKRVAPRSRSGARATPKSITPSPEPAQIDTSKAEQRKLVSTLTKCSHRDADEKTKVHRR
jgi:hypothetical protein